VGKVVPVLVEGASKRDETVLMGRSPKNLTVHAPIPKGVSIDDLQGTFVNVRVDVARAWYLRGQVIS
jgi:tRNA-2-methylthio-N6-dimethylallyladenosine synthase